MNAHLPRRSPAASKEKLPPDWINEMREWIEGTDCSYREIGTALGVSVSTLSRYATQHGWQRPPGATSNSRRGRVTERLWKLTERHAAALEDQPFDVAQRSLQPLARLTRVLGDIDRSDMPPIRAVRKYSDTHCPDAPSSGRSIHELRDELAAHLARITEEEGYGWEEASWWFSHGRGI